MPVKWWISTAKTQLPAHQEIQPFRSPVCLMPPPVMAELLDEMIAFFVAEFQAVIYMIPANPKANPIISIGSVLPKKITGSKNLILQNFLHWSGTPPPQPWILPWLVLLCFLPPEPSMLRLGGETHVKPYRKPENEGIRPRKNGTISKRKCHLPNHLSWIFRGYVSFSREYCKSFKCINCWNPPKPFLSRAISFKTTPRKQSRSTTQAPRHRKLHQPETEIPRLNTKSTNPKSNRTCFWANSNDPKI